MPNEQTKATKHTALKQVLSVCDPLGLFSPIVLLGKVLLQSLWNKCLEWDDELDNVDADTWTSIKQELSKVLQTEVVRCIALKHNTQPKYRLVCFCDASEKAYAAVVYLHQESEDKSKADLEFSKTRMAPIKKLIIPRLELIPCENLF